MYSTYFTRRLTVAYAGIMQLLAATTLRRKNGAKNSCIKVVLGLHRLTKYLQPAAVYALLTNAFPHGRL
jgi:hypothetical protein